MRQISTLLILVVAMALDESNAQTASTWPHNSGQFGKGTRFISVFNRMTKTIYVTFEAGTAPKLVSFTVNAGKDTVIQLPNSWASGQCYATYDKAYTKPFVTLAEWTLGASGAGYADFYDVSLVDAFSLPMLLGPVVGTYTLRPGNLPYDCGAVRCTTDLIPICPAIQQKKNAAGVCIACMSGCQTAHANNWPQARIDSFCCAGPNNVPEKCPSYPIANWFKQQNPDAYSYAYDDNKSTWVCVPPTADHYGPDYYVVFGSTYPPTVQDPRATGTAGRMPLVRQNGFSNGMSISRDRNNVVRYDAGLQGSGQFTLAIYTCGGVLVSRTSTQSSRGVLPLGQLRPGAYIVALSSGWPLAARRVLVLDPQ
jgi:hypothetical protein